MHPCVAFPAILHVLRPPWVARCRLVSRGGSRLGGSEGSFRGCSLLPAQSCPRFALRLVAWCGFEPFAVARPCGEEEAYRGGAARGELAEVMKGTAPRYRDGASLCTAPEKSDLPVHGSGEV